MALIIPLLLLPIRVCDSCIVSRWMAACMWELGSDGRRR